MTGIPSDVYIVSPLYDSSEVNVLPFGPFLIPANLVRNKVTGFFPAFVQSHISRLCKKNA